MQLDVLMKIFYLLSIYLLLLGILEMRKKRKKNKKIITPKAQKTNELALDTEKQAKEILDNIENYKKAGKMIVKTFNKVIDWIKKYWQQLVGLIGSIAQFSLVVYAYIFDKFGFILDLFPKTQGWEIGIKIGVGLLSVLFVFYEIRNQVKWVGIGNIQKAKEYLENRTNETLGKLDENGRNIVSKALKQEKETLKQTNKRLNEYQKSMIEITSAIQTNNALIRLGNNPITPIDELTRRGNELHNLISSTKSLIANCENKIASYETLLK